VLVGGHESSGGAALQRFASADGRVTATASGRPLERAIDDGLARGDSVVVVPMTFGRNPTMVADAAKTLSWIGGKGADVALAAPFGQPDHLTAWLRSAANRAVAQHSADAMLIVAPHSNPFDEADLHRVAHLVRTNGALAEVGVAIADDATELDAEITRWRRLGAERVAIVPAGFEPGLPAADAVFVGPLMSDAAIARVIADRVRDASHELRHGRDGIAAGLLADHGHGYAHSHAFEEGEGRPHTHADGTTHSHTHGAAHSHTHPHAPTPESNVRKEQNGQPQAELPAPR
jgi:hypothetical protein